MLLLVPLLALLPQKPVTVTILHTNDMHAHPEGATMGGKPYGNYARQATLIRRFRQSDPNVILLSGGDTFQGTLYFKTYEGLSDLAFMNQVGYDAACTGNHEFDNGPKALAQFASLANFPILASNIDISGEPLLKGLIHPSTVVKVGDTEIGIVGAVTPDTPSISSPGPTIKFLDLTASVQASVDDLKKRGIDKIVLLTHIGYQEDQRLAKAVRDVDVIVGGHSHSPLGTPPLAGWQPSVGPYPTKVNDSTGQPVYIVQAYEWSKVLGRMKVNFDAAGKVTGVSDAAPIVIDESVPEDPVVKSMLAAFRKPIDALSNQPIGVATVEITRARDGENPMANIIADAMLEATTKQGAVAGFINAGGVRSGIDAGPITFGEAIAVQPFDNTLFVLEVTGEELKRALEDGVPASDKLGGMLYPSQGSSYKVDLKKPLGSRVRDVVIAGKALDPAAKYPITLLGFTASGGDAHLVLKASKGKRTDTGIVDVQALIAYIKAHSPLSPKSEGRLTVTWP